MRNSISLVTALILGSVTSVTFADDNVPVAAMMRPDVAAFVQANYKDAEQTAAATQLGQALQGVLNSGKDSASLEAARQRTTRAMRCVSSVFGPKAGKFPSKVISEIEAKTFDTTARQVSYVAFQKVMRDSSVQVSADKPCEQ